MAISSAVTWLSWPVGEGENEFVASAGLGVGGLASSLHAAANARLSASELALDPR